MTDPFHSPESAPADLLEHDLRRFLHHAHDQAHALNKISKALTSAAGQMKEQAAATKRIHQNLQRQIDSGVTVHVAADLELHTESVSQATAPLVEELERHRRSMREMIIKIAVVTAASGLLGSFVGVFGILRFL